MYPYYPHDLGFIDVQFRDGTWNLFDPDQDSSFYVEIYDADDVLQDTYTLGSTPPIEQISTGKFKVAEIPLTNFAFGVAYYRWYAKKSGVPVQNSPVFEFCFQILETTADTWLCTLADVKEHLRITSDTHDSFLSSLIVRASAFIEDYCHRVFASTEYTEWRTGDGERDLILDNKPVSAIASIEDIRGGVGFSYDVDDEHTYWECELEAGILYLLSDVFPSSPIKAIRIVYTAGYATTPEGVRETAVELVASRWYLRDKQKGGQQSSSFAGQYVVYAPDDLTPMMIKMLAPYRRQMLGSV